VNKGSSISSPDRQTTAMEAQLARVLLILCSSSLRQQRLLKEHLLVGGSELHVARHVDCSRTEDAQVQTKTVSSQS